MAGLFDTIGDFLGLNKGKATEKAAKENRGLINELAPVGREIIGGIQDTTGDFLNLGKTGADLYADAMGLNGADGAARAGTAFQTGPGYDFARDQGLDAVMRKASATGRVQSGNTDLDLLRYATGYADQTFGDWLTRLGGYNDMYAGGVDRDNAAAGLGLDFESGLTSALMGSNNQKAAGKEAGQGAGLDALATIAGIGGKVFSGGYGGFGGAPSYAPPTYSGGLRLGYQAGV